MISTAYISTTPGHHRHIVMDFFMTYAAALDSIEEIIPATPYPDNWRRLEEGEISDVFAGPEVAAAWQAVGLDNFEGDEYLVISEVIRRPW